ncbi:MAG: ComF family protein [Clostridia bacterium]|nr:ComF family protein [Clostridia bacterium]
MSSFLSKVFEFISPSYVACYLCAEESVPGADNLCDRCRNELMLCIAPPPAPYLDGCAAGLVYTDPVRRAMHRFKYHDRREYADFFAQYMAVPVEWEVDIIAPVPLHYLKELFRTYNQSETLAKRISAAYKLPYCRDLIERVRYTGSQTHRSPKERAKNVRGAFKAAPEVKGLSVLLIDDVFTTGATLSACAKALKSAGALRVYSLCACRAES